MDGSVARQSNTTSKCWRETVPKVSKIIHEIVKEAMPVPREIVDIETRYNAVDALLDIGLQIWLTEGEMLADGMDFH